MRNIIVALVTTFVLVFGTVVSSVATTVIVAVSNQGVEAANNRAVIAVALPEGVVGKRVDSAVLEVPITLRASMEALFNEFPLVQLYEDGSEMSKQTVLFERGFDGIARFDVTRFVRAWSTTETRQFVLGAVSESNGTVVTLAATPAGWCGGQKARLVIDYRSLDGASLKSKVE